MIDKVFQENLLCPLSDAEVQERATRQANLQAEIDDLVEEAKDTASQLKSDRKSLESKRREVAREIRERAIWLYVDCIEKLENIGTDDEPDWVVKRIRMDTGDEIEEKTRPATEAEKQLTLPDDPEEGDAPEPDPDAAVDAAAKDTSVFD